MKGFQTHDGLFGAPQYEGQMSLEGRPYSTASVSKAGKMGRMVLAETSERRARIKRKVFMVFVFVVFGMV